MLIYEGKCADGEVPLPIPFRECPVGVRTQDNEWMVAPEQTF